MSVDAKYLTKALSLKEKGNKLFRVGQFSSSVKLYTEALFYAPCLGAVLQEKWIALSESCDGFLKEYLYHHSLPAASYEGVDDMIVAHCYNNRSAALFELKEYESALVDIDNAELHKYPQDQFKLHRRKALCLSYLGRQSDAMAAIKTYKQVVKGLVPEEKVRKNADSLVKEISLIKRLFSQKRENHQDNKSDYTSSSAYIHHSSDKGRCVMTKRSIQFGECVLLETPYVSVLDRIHLYTHCSYCFKEALNLIPCCFCVFAGYCSFECMKIAWKSYHWSECVHGRELYHDYWLTMTTRLLLASPYEDIQILLKECEKTDFDSAIVKLTSEDSTLISDAYKAILQLSVPNFGETTALKYEEGVERIMKIYLDSFMDYYQLDTSTLVFLRELLKRHLLQIRINPLLVSTSSLPTNYQEGVEMQSVDEQNFGPALYLTASLFSHSCDHNMLRRFIGNRVEVLVYCSSLKKGDEMCLSYGPKIGHMKRTDRLKMIKSTRFFDCLCNVCLNPERTMLYREYGWYGLSCPRCKGLLPQPDSGTVSECLDCGKSSDISQLLKIKCGALRVCNEEASLGQLLRSYKELVQVLYVYNTELSDVCKLITSRYVQRRDFKSAVPYCKQRCDTLEAIHGSSSLELSAALPNYSRILFSSDAVTSVKVARKALKLVELFYGVEDEDAKLLRDFLKSVSKH